MADDQQQGLAEFAAEVRIARDDAHVAAAPSTPLTWNANQPLTYSASYRTAGQMTERTLRIEVPIPDPGQTYEVEVTVRKVGDL